MAEIEVNLTCPFCKQQMKKTVESREGIKNDGIKKITDKQWRELSQTGTFYVCLKCGFMAWKGNLRWK